MPGKVSGDAKVFKLLNSHSETFETLKLVLANRRSAILIR